MGRRKIPTEHVNAIVEHVTPLLDGIDAALSQLPKRDNAQTGAYVKNQRLYFRHLRASLRWVIATAKQRDAGKNNVQ